MHYPRFEIVSTDTRLLPVVRSRVELYTTHLELTPSNIG